MAEYWTIQPLALRRRQLLVNQHRTCHADVHSDGAAHAMPSEREILHGGSCSGSALVNGERERSSKTTLSSAD